MKHTLFLLFSVCLFAYAQTDSTQTTQPLGSEVMDSVKIITPENPDGFIFAEKEPIPLNMDEVRKLIGYPVDARDNGIQGRVVVRVLVSETGEALKYKLISSPDSTLSEPVLAHVLKLKFSPAIQKKKPIKFWVNIPFDFKLIGYIPRKKKKKKWWQY